MSAKTKTIWTFVISSVALFMVTLDNLIVTTAIPVIRQDLDASLESLLDTYRAARSRTVAMLTALDEPGWARTGTHETFGVLDISGLLSRAIDHDEEHLRSLAG